MKTYVITGATSGIGLIAATAIARTGANVVFNARDMKKGEAIRQQIISQTNNPNVFCFEADFASLSSVANFAHAVQQKFDVIDVLINNAGTWEMQFRESADGIEMNFAVNHLAPFVLTNLLLDTVIKSSSARIINTSSMAHRRNILQLDDLEFRNTPYNGFYSYSQSKLCNILFSVQLEKELKTRGVNHVTVNSLHPGLVKTALFDKMSPQELSFFGSFTPVDEGAKTTIFLALSSTVEGVSGRYWFQDTPVACSPMATDEILASKLWNISKSMASKFLKNN